MFEVGGCGAMAGAGGVLSAFGAVSCWLSMIVVGCC